MSSIQRKVTRSLIRSVIKSTKRGIIYNDDGEPTQPSDWISDPAFAVNGVYPTFWADFINNRYAVNDAAVPITDILTVTRSTTKNVFNSSGELESVAINTPAFDHDPVTLEPLGLLVEEQRTNICPHSDAPFTNWPVLSASKSAAGSNFLGYFTNGAVISSTGAVWNGLTVSGMGWSSGVVLSWSLFVKSGTSNKVRVYLKASTGHESVLEGTLGGALTSVDATAGVITYTSNIAVDGGYIYNGTFTPNTTTAIGTVIITPASTVSGETVVFYGFQLEAGAFPTSFISTGAGAVTRGADSVVNNASNVIPFADWYNQVEGCLFTEAKAAYNTATTARRVAEISDGTTNNRWLHNIEVSAGNNLSIFVGSGASSQFSNVSALTSNEFRKFASALKTDGAYAIGGSIIATDGTVTIPASVTQLNIGQSYSGNRINGWIKSIRYYPARITNLELVRITT